MNAYTRLANDFKLLDCVVRQRDALGRCGRLSGRTAGRDPGADARNLLFGLLLVCVVAQLEHDLDLLDGVPGLRGAGSLSARLRLLRDHFQISHRKFSQLDKIRDARNSFVHSGAERVSLGLTRAEVPGCVVEFLQCCEHPSYP
ncbi:MAG TPA: hypothetical protein VGN26_22035 [Armatimonadota bacterium]|jgi:hypothetical protein